MARRFSKAEVLAMPQYPLTIQNLSDAFDLVRDAHDFAVNKFPSWPISIYAGDDIIAEEFGEGAKAALDAKWKNHPMSDLLLEHAQAAAMHIRQLQHILNVDED